MANVSKIDAARGTIPRALSGPMPERRESPELREASATSAGSELSASTVVVLDVDPLLREAWLSLVQRLNTHAQVLAVGSVDELSSVSEPVLQRVDLVLVNTSHVKFTAPESVRMLEDLAALVPECPVVCIVGRVMPIDIAAGVKHRIRGFIPTTMSASVAVHALNLVRAGGIFVPDSVVLDADPTVGEVAEGAGDSPRSGAGAPEQPPQGHFTPRQRQVLDMLRLGLQNKVIAYELGMKESTVKIHIRHIMRKLSLHSRTQVALYAQKLENSKT